MSIAPVPWDWTVEDADEFFAHERSILNLAFATIRAHQAHLKLFCDFLTDPGYEWDRICVQGFGRSPVQIITELNRARHAQNNEQAPAKRPFSRAELQRFFDLADLEVERVLASGRKGAVAAYRDATVFKTAYAWGLRPGYLDPDRAALAVPCRVGNLPHGHRGAGSQVEPAPPLPGLYRRARLSAGPRV
ncbi:hypothetical protein LVY72_09575 [Arthrobacter sp. I2-34]|uniref:Integrase n=1 Tax=Arthrobacter hankyongi TaxID=2904801 RepID=A0ABS9L671_9MICC|nr:hypothetical protein [Arthrobacter hankyongi]MCG2622167.1 hypothetical protein [Arthrobacter hankyongi]